MALKVGLNLLTCVFTEELKPEDAGTEVAQHLASKRKGCTHVHRNAAKVNDKGARTQRVPKKHRSSTLVKHLVHPPGGSSTADALTISRSLGMVCVRRMPPYISQPPLPSDQMKQSQSLGGDVARTDKHLWVTFLAWISKRSLVHPHSRLSSRINRTRGVSDQFGTHGSAKRRLYSLRSKAHLQGMIWSGCWRVRSGPEAYMLQQARCKNCVTAKPSEVGQRVFAIENEKHAVTSSLSSFFVQQLPPCDRVNNASITNHAGMIFEDCKYSESRSKRFRNRLPRAAF
eukprot:5733757-Amphidinium_carterae.1